MNDSQKLEIAISELKEELNTADESNKSSLHLDIARFYNRLERFEEALIYAEYAMEYATEEISHYRGVWMKGLIYKKMGIKAEALKHYDMCIKFYIFANKRLQLGDMYKNKSRLLNCPILGLQAVETFKVADEATIDDIDDAYGSLAEVYTNIEEYEKALEAAKEIQDDALKIEVVNKVQKHFII